MSDQPATAASLNHLTTHHYRENRVSRHTGTTEIPPGTPPPKVSVEVWTRGEGTELPPEQIGATVADVVRINDTWHVVVSLDE